MAPRKTLRVGTVPYLVGRPLDAGLEDEPGIALSKAPPARLVEGLREGSLDVALVSSIELFRREGYRYLDGLAVWGEGFVGSVQVFLRRPLEDVRTIAMDPASRAAATLVRILLRGRGFVDVPAGIDPASAEADAWLEIGDAALRRTLAEGAPEAFNPSREWTRVTGQPFVFALWIARPGVEIAPAELDAFVRARARGRQRLGELAARAAREWNLPREACWRYLAEDCRYEARAGFARALREFRDQAAALDLCLGSLAPEAIALSEAHVP